MIGCGKSSRIPVMLLEEAQENRTYCKMMVSQPRRIAASSLMKRVRSTLGMQVINFFIQHIYCHIYIYIHNFKTNILIYDLIQ